MFWGQCYITSGTEICCCLTLSGFLIAQFPLVVPYMTERNFWRRLFNFSFQLFFSFYLFLGGIRLDLVTLFVNIDISSQKQYHFLALKESNLGFQRYGMEKFIVCDFASLWKRRHISLPSLVAVTQVYSCLWDLGDTARPFLLNFCVIPNSVNFSNHLRSAPDGVTFCFMGRFESIPFA